MCLQVFTFGFDLSLVLKIGIKNIFYKVACLGLIKIESTHFVRHRIWNAEQHKRLLILSLRSFSKVVMVVETVERG